jgi:hypothetical protein
MRAHWLIKALVESTDVVTLSTTGVAALNATIEGVNTEKGAHKDECLAELFYLNSLVDHTLQHQQSDRCLNKIEKEIMQKEENKANPNIVKYFIRTLSMYNAN